MQWLFLADLHRPDLVLGSYGSNRSPHRELCSPTRALHRELQGLNLTLGEPAYMADWRRDEGHAMTAASVKRLFWGCGRHRQSPAVLQAIQWGTEDVNPPAGVCAGHPGPRSWLVNTPTGARTGGAPCNPLQPSGSPSSESPFRLSFLMVSLCSLSRP